jgi:hypothetical protein
MKEVTLSTGQVAVLRTKDELTEGQSRKIEVARARGAAVFQRLGTESEGKLSIPPEQMDKLSDEDYTNLRGFEDNVISVLTISLDGEPIGQPTDLMQKTYDALSSVALAEYAGLAQAPEGPDEKIDPLAEAAGSTVSS